jgi:zinc transport system substrate-binding protein
MKFDRSGVMSYLAILLAILMGWSTNIHAAAPLSVFVSILPQKHFVERIGGSRVQVSVMVGQGQSEETYEPTLRQMVKLARARLYFRIGLPFESVWLESIMEANPKIRVVDCQHGIALLSTANSHPALEVGDQHKTLDPHIWTSPPLVKIMAVHIRNALIAVDPAYSHQFEENYQALIHDLDQLDQFIRKTLAGITHHRFMVFHPAWRYFAHTYGLEEIAIEQAGKEPGAKFLAALIEQGRQENIRAIFVQKQFSRAKAELVARAIGAEVITLDPLAEDYANNLRHVATVLAEVLQ